MEKNNKLICPKCKHVYMTGIDFNDNSLIICPKCFHQDQAKNFRIRYSESAVKTLDSFAVRMKDTIAENLEKKAISEGTMRVTSDDVAEQIANVIGFCSKDWIVE